MFLKMIRTFILGGGGVSLPHPASEPPGRQQELSEAITPLLETFKLPQEMKLKLL